MKIHVVCKCGEHVEVSSSDAAKVMRANRKTKLTSEQAKEMQLKRWPKKQSI